MIAQENRYISFYNTARLWLTFYAVKKCRMSYRLGVTDQDFNSDVDRESNGTTHTCRGS
jgi:hypothetical protein